MLSNPTSMKEILRRQNSMVIYCQISPVSLLDVSADNCQTALVGESEIISGKMGTPYRSQMPAVQGSPCAPTP